MQAIIIVNRFILHLHQDQLQEAEADRPEDYSHLFHLPHGQHTIEHIVHATLPVSSASLIFSLAFR